METQFSLCWQSRCELLEPGTKNRDRARRCQHVINETWRGQGGMKCREKTRKYEGRQDQMTTARWDERKGGVPRYTSAPDGISQSVTGKVFLISMLPLPAQRKIVSTSTLLTGEFKSLKHMLHYSDIRYCSSVRQKQEEEHMFSESKQIPVRKEWEVITTQKWYFPWKLLEGRDNVL